MKINFRFAAKHKVTSWIQDSPPAVSNLVIYAILCQYVTYISCKAADTTSRRNGYL